MRTEVKRVIIMGLSRKATSLLTVLSVWKTIILVDDSWVRTHLTDALVSMKGCHVGQVQNDGQNELLEILTETYEDL